MSQNLSFFRLPKKVRKVSLSKRSSMSQLQQVSVASQSCRPQLSDRLPTDNLKNKQLTVDVSPKQFSLSRYHWLSLLRQEFIRIARHRQNHTIPKKRVISIVESSKHNQIAAFESSNIDQLKLPKDEIIMLVQNYPQSRFGLDDLYLSLSGIAPNQKECCQTRASTHQDQPPKALDDPETARFNDDNCRQFPELQSIRTIQLHSPKVLAITGDNSYFCRSGNEYTNMFEGLFRDTCRTIKEIQVFRTKKSERQFIQQLLSYGLYKNENGNFYGTKLLDIEAPSSLTQLLTEQSIMDFFKYMEALRVSRSRLTPPLYIMFTCSLKILNLSNNNLGDLSFLTNCQDLEFLNVNYNSISNLSNLKNLKCLIEIHCFGNLIQSVSLSQHNLSKLRIIDLGKNRITGNEALVSIQSLNSLRLLNLIQNPIMSIPGFKKTFRRRFPQIKGCEFPEVYIFSDFSRFKDIAFFAEAEKEQLEVHRSRSKDFRDAFQKI